jgi:hypothetical protein
LSETHPLLLQKVLARFWPPLMQLSPLGSASPKIVGSRSSYLILYIVDALLLFFI